MQTTVELVEHGTSRLDLLRNARNLGLVLGGGSMRCAFQVGVIRLLGELGIRPGLIIGISGGVWNSAALSVGREHRLPYYWRCFARMPWLDPFNIGREHSPFIFNRIHRRTFERFVGTEELKKPGGIPLLVGVTRLRDKKFVLLDPRQIDDPLQALLASNYLPPFFTHAPVIDGEAYGDGGATNNVPYDEAFARGCDAVLLVSLKGEAEGGLYRSPKDHEHVIPEEFCDRVVVVRPRKRVDHSFTEYRVDRLSKIMDLGYLRAREAILGESHPQTNVGRDDSSILTVLIKTLTKIRRLRARGSGPRAQ